MPIPSHVALFSSESVASTAKKASGRKSRKSKSKSARAVEIDQIEAGGGLKSREPASDRGMDSGKDVKSRSLVGDFYSTIFRERK